MFLIFWPALAADYRWPLDLPPILTSSFGDYRTGHPHAGLDLGIQGEVGKYAVLAVNDGYVLRLKTSPVGYGKTVYVALADGRTAVYGHLDRFSERIQAVVREYQRAAGRYSIDQMPPPERLPVRRGEMLGLAGDTGTDAPHLHFEIRGPDNCPLNPLTHGFPVADHIPPTPLRLRIVPASPAARVDGWALPGVYDLRIGRGGVYGLTGTPSVFGPVGLEIEAADRSDTSDRDIAPLAIELRDERRPIFETRFDRTCYEEKWVIDHQYDPGPRLRGAGTFFRLFDRFRTRVGFFSGPGDGRIEIVPGQTREMRIAFVDAAGNRAEAAFSLVGNRPPEIGGVTWDLLGGQNVLQVTATDPDGEVPRVVARFYAAGERLLHEATLVPRVGALQEILIDRPPLEVESIRIVAADGHGLSDRTHFWCGHEVLTVPPLSWTVEEGDGLLTVEIRPQFALRRPPVLAAFFSDPAGGSPIPATEVALRAHEWTSYRAAVPLPEGRSAVVRLRAGVRREDERLWLDERTVTAQLVADGRRVRSADGLAEVAFGEGAVFEPFHVQVREAPAAAFRGLRPVGLAYAFGRDDMPFKNDPAVRLKLPPGENPAQVGLYLVEPDRAWFLNGTPSQGAFTATPTHLGTFALYRDEAPPWIGELSPKEGSTVDGKDLVVAFSCGDEGSGLAEEGIAVFLDGERLIAEWHPFRGTVRAEVDHPLAPGPHTIKVSLADRAGNAVFRSASFRVR